MSPTLPPTILTPVNTWRRFALVLIAFLVLNFLQRITVVQAHMLLTMGMIFSVFWLTPKRYWFWFYAIYCLTRPSEWWLVETIKNGPVEHFNLLQTDVNVWLTALSIWFQPIPPLLAALYLRVRHIGPEQIETHRGMLGLHIAALISAVLGMCKDLLYAHIEGSQPDMQFWALRIFLGHFVGVMLIAPLSATLIVARFRNSMGPILTWTLLAMIPAIVLLISLGQFATSQEARSLLRMLVLLVVVLFTIKFDWRGAAISLLVVGITFSIVEIIGSVPLVSFVNLQAFVAIAGAMALLFGTALETLKSRNRQLADVLLSNERLSAELGAATLRNIEAEDRERRHLASELHDEFGQSLTAMQMHLNLVSRDFPETSSEIQRLSSINASMRKTIKSVLNTLRPVGLDEVGLYAMLNEGSIKQLAEDAGIRYSFAFDGDVRLLSQLSDLIKLTLYRTAQEGITNAVRHSGATHCVVKLRVGHRWGCLVAIVSVDDNGAGRIAQVTRGNGLRGLNDRITSIGGRLSLKDRRQGLCVHAMLTQPI